MLSHFNSQGIKTTTSRDTFFTAFLTVLFEFNFGKPSIHEGCELLRGSDKRTIETFNQNVLFAHIPRGFIAIDTVASCEAAKCYFLTARTFSLIFTTCQPWRSRLA